MSLYTCISPSLVISYYITYDNITAWYNWSLWNDYSWCFICRNFMVITLLWTHICFPSIFWVAVRYGRKGLIISWELIQQIIRLVREISNIFSEYMFLTKRVEIGIQPSYLEQLKGLQLSFYLWRNVPWFVISSHQRQQRDLQSVLRYGITYSWFQNITTIHFSIIFQKLKQYFIYNQGHDCMLGFQAKR